MKYLVSICLLFCCLHLSAQEKHFIFIQSDNSQPFYVSLNGKLYSSSASGYLIVPRLLDGQYKFSVGFARNEFPEQNFQCVIEKKDLGYNLKNFGDKGWGLFNLQTLDVTMAGSTNTNEVAKAVSEIAMPKADIEKPISFEKPKKDSMIKPEAKKVADSAIVQNTVSGTEQQASVANDKTSTPADTSSVREETANETAAITNSSLQKVSEVKSADGVYLSYVDSTGKSRDTIQVIIPSSGSSVTPNSSSGVDSTDLSPEASAPQKQKAANITDKDGVKFLDIDMNGAAKNAATVAQTNENTLSTASTGNCKNVATDEDYVRLRKKMAMETSDEKMIDQAKKSYRNKCFTTSQIKGLSALFLSDEGRYKFFDASYVSVADAAQYPSLQSEFIDPAFVSRFKAMIQ